MSSLEIVNLSLLENLAATVPHDAKASNNGAGGGPKFDLQDWISKFNVPVGSPSAWNGGTKWIFPVCPFDAAHNNRSAILMQFPSGAVAFKCQHDGCAPRKWSDLRDRYEPVRDRKRYSGSSNGPRSNVEQPDSANFHSANGAKPGGSQPASKPDDFCVPASTIKTRPVRWIIPLHLVRGNIQEFIGDPKKCKTTVLLDLLARISSGRGFPDGTITPECVMYLSGEDGREDTLAPRLIEAKADMKKVFLMNRFFPSEDEHGVPNGEGLTPVSFPEHIEKIEQHIIANNVAVFVADPITGFLSGRVQSHNDASTRKVLCELSAMAERTDCAVVLVRHLNKMSTEDKAIYRGGGSIAFSAAARTGFTIGADPTERGVQDGDPQRRYVMACHANNLGPEAPSRAFRKVVDPETITEESPYGITHIEWCEGTVAVTADDLVRRQHKQKKSEAVEEAMDFLRAELRGGDARLSDTIEQKAQALKISAYALRGARRKLKIIAGREHGSFGGPWTMRMPVNDDGEPTADDDPEQETNHE